MCVIVVTIRRWADVSLWVAVSCRKFLCVGLRPRWHAWHSHRKSRSQLRFHHYQINERYGQVSLFFHFFRNSFLFLITVSFTMAIKKSPGGESAGGGRLTSKSTCSCVVPVRELWPRRMLLLGFVQAASRWSHQLTSDPRRCLLFWKCLQWLWLKAVSVPTFVIGGLWGSTATSASCFTAMSTSLPESHLSLKLQWRNVRKKPKCSRGV